jgi:hypothetical protein
MHKDTIEITNRGLWFKLINFTSFGESMFSARFIQKTVKRYLFVKENIGIPPRHQRGKDLEDSRTLSTKAWAKSHRSGPVGLWGMPPGLQQGPLVSSFQNVPPPPPRVASTPFLKSVWSEGSRWTLRPINTALYPLAWRHPETLIHVL